MRARVSILLPYSFDIPKGAQFQIANWRDENSSFTVQLPFRVPELDSPRDPQIVADGIRTYRGRALVIDFHKEKFDRRAGIEGTDPPLEDIFRVANWWLQRLRTVTRATNISLISPTDAPWNIDYCNDDGSELPVEEGFVRGRGMRSFDISHNVVTPVVWKNATDLPPDYESPAWVTLLLDARKLLPEIGPPIVLATAALETLIKYALVKLAAKAGLPKDFWSWLNERTPIDRQPSTVEEYGVLLKILAGKSLQESATLWEGFQNLRTARNSFVHEGVARIGKGKTAVTRDEAIYLVNCTEKIVAFVRDLLPEDSRWPVFEYKINLQITTSLFRAPTSPESKEGQKDTTPARQDDADSAK